MKIKDIAKVDRPREKLIRYGPDKLSNPELLGIILGKGTKGNNAVNMAKNLLNKFSEDKLANIQFNDLKNIKGIGETKACQIIATIELGKRIFKGKKSRLIFSPREVWEQMNNIRGSKKEHCYIFYLDIRNQIIRKELISIGTLNASLIHPREVFEPAVRLTAAQIIISHNHPSGDASPSDEDIILTRRLVEAGKILGIDLIDHVVVTDKSFSSLKEKGLI